MSSDRSPFSPSRRANLPQSPGFVLGTPERNALKSPIVFAPMPPTDVAALGRALDENLRELKAFFFSISPEGIQEKLEKIIAKINEGTFDPNQTLTTLDELTKQLSENHELLGHIASLKIKIAEWMANQIIPSVIRTVRNALQTEPFVSYLKKNKVIGEDADIQYFYENLAHHPEILEAYQTYMAISPAAQVTPRRGLFTPSFDVRTPSTNTVRAIKRSNAKHIRNEVWLIADHSSNENTPVVRKVFDERTQSWVNPPIPRKRSLEEKFRETSHPKTEPVLTADELFQLLLETLKYGPGKVFGAPAYKYMFELRRDLVALAEKLKPFNPHLTKKILKFISTNRENKVSEEIFKKNAEYFYLELKFPQARDLIAFKKFHDGYVSYLEQLEPRGLANAFIEALETAKENINEQLSKDPHEVLTEILTDELINLNTLLKKLEEEEYEEGELLNDYQTILLLPAFQYAHVKATEQFNRAFYRIIENHNHLPSPNLSEQKKRRLAIPVILESPEQEESASPAFPKTQPDVSDEIFPSPKKGMSSAAKRMAEILGRMIKRTLAKEAEKKRQREEIRVPPRFRILPVLGDGECGYRGFGIERNDAYAFLSDNLDNPDQEALLTDGVFRAHLQRNHPDKLLVDEFIQDAAEHYSADPEVARDFITYDILHRKINMGYVHPAVLQALAHIRNVGLRIWRLADDGVTFIPHQNGNAEDYGSYIPANAERIIDLLFVNGNHFNVLQTIENDLVELPAVKPRQSLSHGFFQAESSPKRARAFHLSPDAAIDRFKNIQTEMKARIQAAFTVFTTTGTVDSEFIPIMTGITGSLDALIDLIPEQEAGIRNIIAAHAKDIVTLMRHAELTTEEMLKTLHAKFCGNTAEVAEESKRRPVSPPRK
jgi:hypothetical protein